MVLTLTSKSEAPPARRLDARARHGRRAVLCPSRQDAGRARRWRSRRELVAGHTYLHSSMGDARRWATGAGDPCPGTLKRRAAFAAGEAASARQVRVLTRSLAVLGLRLPRTPLTRYIGRRFARSEPLRGSALMPKNHSGGEGEGG